MCFSRGGGNAKDFVRCTTRHLKEGSLKVLKVPSCMLAEAAVERRIGHADQFFLSDAQLDT